MTYLLGGKKTCSGIFRTNNFALGPDPQTSDHGVFPLCSRLNHSCAPNCEVFWDQERQIQVSILYSLSCKHELRSIFQRVVAIRNIEKDTELTLCYLGEKDRFTGVEKRRKILRNYGFVCNCDTCKTEEDLNEDPYYLKDYMKLENLIDSQNMLGSIFLEKEKILERNCSKIIWRILNFKNAIIHYANVDPSSLEYELIFDKLRRLEELVKIQRSL